METRRTLGSIGPAKEARRMNPSEPHHEGPKRTKDPAKAENSLCTAVLVDRSFLGGFYVLARLRVG